MEVISAKSFVDKYLAFLKSNGEFPLLTGSRVLPESEKSSARKDWDIVFKYRPSIDAIAFLELWDCKWLPDDGSAAEQRPDFIFSKKAEITKGVEESVIVNIIYDSRPDGFSAWCEATAMLISLGKTVPGIVSTRRERVKVFKACFEKHGLEGDT